MDGPVIVEQTLRNFNETVTSFNRSVSPNIYRRKNTVYKTHIYSDYITMHVRKIK